MVSVSMEIPAEASPHEKTPMAAKTQVASGRKFLFLVRPQNLQGLRLIHQSPFPAVQEKGLEFFSNFFPSRALKFFFTQGPQFQPLTRHFFPDLNHFLTKPVPKFLKSLRLIVSQVQLIRPAFPLPIGWPGRGKAGTQAVNQDQRQSSRPQPRAENYLQKSNHAGYDHLDFRASFLYRPATRALRQAQGLELAEKDQSNRSGRTSLPIFSSAKTIPGPLIQAQVLAGGILPGKVLGHGIAHQRPPEMGNFIGF